MPPKSLSTFYTMRKECWKGASQLDSNGFAFSGVIMGVLYFPPKLETKLKPKKREQFTAKQRLIPILYNRWADKNPPKSSKKNIAKFGVVILILFEDVYD